MNNNGTLNAETQRKSPQGKILQPKLRFKGFADPWQQRKLGELAELSKGAGFSKRDLCEHGRGIILYGQMYTNYQLVIDCISTHVPMNSHGVESRRNDIIVPASGETPEDIATASVVKLDGVLLGGDINVIRLHGNQTDATFIALLLSHGSLHKTLASRAQGKSIVHLHISDIANLHVLKPGITEQSRIAEFFRVLDDRIAAAKKKADLLKLKKRYYLQAVFSQRLRFKGFTEPWQQRKLGELLSVRKETTTTPTLYRIDIELENLQEDGGLVGDTTVRTNSTSVFRRGDVLFGRLRPYLRKWWLATESGIRSGEIWAIYSPSRVLTSSFVYALVQSPIFLQVALITSGTKMPRSDWENIASAAGSLPCSNDEQARIGDFFNKLNNLIAASCRKIELLERCKDAYLQLLFI